MAAEAGDVGEARDVPRPSFRELYFDAYVPMVRLAHLLTGSREVGEEITQEAFARAYGRFDRLHNPGGYVRTSVVRGCRSWHRRQVVERRSLHRLVPLATSTPLTGELVDALGALPFRQRAALVMRFYEDKTTEEIAAALGCRPGTAKSLVSRGLQALREVIER